MFGGTAGLGTTPSSIRALVLAVMCFAQCLTTTTSFGSSIQIWTVLSGHISEWNWMLRVFVWVTWQQVRVKLYNARGCRISPNIQSINSEKNKTEACSDALSINKTVRANWILSANAKFSPPPCPYFPLFLKKTSGWNLLIHRYHHSV